MIGAIGPLSPTTSLPGAAEADDAGLAGEIVTQDGLAEGLGAALGVAAPVSGAAGVGGLVTDALRTPEQKRNQQDQQTLVLQRFAELRGEAELERTLAPYRKLELAFGPAHWSERVRGGVDRD